MKCAEHMIIALTFVNGYATCYKRLMRTLLDHIDFYIAAPVQCAGPILIVLKLFNARCDDLRIKCRSYSIPVGGSHCL